MDSLPAGHRSPVDDFSVALLPGILMEMFFQIRAENFGPLGARNFHYLDDGGCSGARGAAFAIVSNSATDSLLKAIGIHYEVRDHIIRPAAVRVIDHAMHSAHFL
jgi:hypothetical protein